MIRTDELKSWISRIQRTRRVARCRGATAPSGRRRVPGICGNMAVQVAGPSLCDYGLVAARLEEFRHPFPSHYLSLTHLDRVHRMLPAICATVLMRSMASMKKSHA